MSAAFVGFERRDAETHRRAVILSRGRCDDGPSEGQRYDQRTQAQPPEDGGR
jgi:hypothetical protein